MSTAREDACRQAVCARRWMAADDNTDCMVYSGADNRRAICMLCIFRCFGGSDYARWRWMISSEPRVVRARPGPCIPGIEVNLDGLPTCLECGGCAPSTHACGCYVPSLRAHVKTRFPNAAHSASTHQPSPLFSRSTGDDGTQGYPVMNTRSGCAMAVVCAGHCCGRGALSSVRSFNTLDHAVTSATKPTSVRERACTWLVPMPIVAQTPFGWLGVQANRTAREVDSQ
jgi:hypothetical protein